MKPTTAYLRFELRRIFRNRRYVTFTIFMPLVLYYVLSRQGAARVTNGIPFETYFAVSMISYSAISSALNAGGARLAAERTTGWLRQIKITPLSTAGFVAAKVAVAVCVAIPGSILIGLVGVFGNSVQLGVLSWLQLYVTIWLAVVPFAGLGMAIGFAFDVETAQVAMVGVLLVVSIIGGLWAPITTFPPLLQDVGKALPTYQMADAARAALKAHAPPVVDILGLLVWTAIFAAIFAWLYRRDEVNAT